MKYAHFRASLMLTFRGFFSIGVFLAGFVFARTEESPAARVIVLANSNDEESVQLARYYAEKRGVPVANVVSLPMPPGETISWRAFIDSVHQPLQDVLINQRWIDAVGGASRDAIGRKKYAISGHRIAYLVVCRGVPLRIESDGSLADDNPLLARRNELRTNQAAVDGELALLAQPSPAINALVPNPLFRREKPTQLLLEQVVKVSRLDGPTYEDAKGLVDHAMEAEKTGLIGRGYVDIGGPHAEGDVWLERALKEIDQLGFDVTTDRDGATFSSSVRFDRPVLYFGWYAGDLNGPLAKAGFRFPPGAIALHIHSFSATTLRSANSGWCGPLVARGVTATFGNVYEPYLTFTHHPELLMQALARGWTLGDAIFYALPALSWQEVAIGDPLYRPFAVGFVTQWENRSSLSDEEWTYVVLRYLKNLERAGQIEKTEEAGANVLRERPIFLVALSLAEIQLAAGKSDAAWQSLAPWQNHEPRGENEAIQLFEMSQQFVKAGAVAQGLQLAEAALSSTALTKDQRIPRLTSASKTAEDVGEKKLAEQWQREAETLASDLPAEKK